MVKDFPIWGIFTPKTDYVDQLPLNTEERKSLKKTTAQSLNLLQKELGWSYHNLNITGKVKTFDAGYGLRVRDENGNKKGTIYKWEKVRILERRKWVTIENGQNKNFIKVEVFNEKWGIDRKRSGWVAEDFVEVDQKSIDKTISKLEKRVNKGGVLPEKKPEGAGGVLPEKKPEGAGGVTTEGTWKIKIPSSAGVVEGLKKILSKSDIEAKRLAEEARKKTEAEAKTKAEAEAKRLAEEAGNIILWKINDLEGQLRKIYEKPSAHKSELLLLSSELLKIQKEWDIIASPNIKGRLQNLQQKIDWAQSNSLGILLKETTIDMLKTMHPNAKIAYDRMIERARDQGSNFIIADKKKAMFYLFNQYGQSLVRFPFLSWKQAWDETPKSSWGKDPDSLTESEKVTPAGIFVLGWMYKSDYLKMDALNLGEDWDGDWYIDDDSDLPALHPVYLWNSWEKRSDRLASNTPKDNKISYGCLNIAEKDFYEWIQPCFWAGWLIAVTPDDVSMIDKYIPPYRGDSLANN